MKNTHLLILIICVILHWDTQAQLAHKIGRFQQDG